MVNERAYAYMLNSELDISICGLVKFIEDKDLPTLSIIDNKNKFITISYNGNLDNVLTDYILSLIDTLTTDKDIDECRNIISNNIDIFFDIINDDSIYTCEIQSE